MDIVVTNCRIKNSNSQPTNQITPMPIKKYTDFNSVAAPKEEETPAEKKIVIIKPSEKDDLQPIKVKCKSCGCETTDDDIKFCDECGKETCSNCRTVTENKGLCEACWVK
jgi:hypothetical protein